MVEPMTILPRCRISSIWLPKAQGESPCCGGAGGGGLRDEVQSVLGKLRGEVSAAPGQGGDLLPLIDGLQGALGGEGTANHLLGGEGGTEEEEDVEEDEEEEEEEGAEVWRELGEKEKAWRELGE